MVYTVMLRGFLFVCFILTLPLCPGKTVLAKELFFSFTHYKNITNSNLQNITLFIF